jgi:hypothetical protein
MPGCPSGAIFLSGGLLQYVVVERTDRGTYWHDPEPYLEALPQLEARLPIGARAFATDPDHYDFTAVRCVKDLRLVEVPSAVDSRLSLRFERGPRLGYGATIDYIGVTSFDVMTEDGGRFDLSDFNSLRLDEPLPHPAGCTHELAFTTARMLITCADLTVRWDPVS